MALPDFPVVDELIKQLSTVSYSDAKAGQTALARVAQQPQKADQVRRALSLLGEQLNLPLTRYQPAPMTATGGGGAMVPPSGPPVGTATASPMNDPRMIRAQGAMVRRVAPEIAKHIEAGKTPAQAARMVVQGPLGKTMNSLSDAFRSAGFRHPIETAARVVRSPGARRGAALAAGGGGAGAGATMAAGAAGGSGAGLFGGALGAAGALLPPALVAGLTAKAVKDLADTQDPMKQMRYMAGPRALDKKLTARDLDMGEVSGKFSRRQLEQLRDEGVVDDSVVNAYRAPGTSRIPGYDAQAASAPETPATRERIVLDEMEINAERPRVGSERTGNLMKGARGANVTEVQKKLSALGSLTPGVEFDLGETGADGIYGDKTAAAVKKFQSISGIKADGIVGPETQAALDKALGSVSDAGSPEVIAKTGTAPSPTASAGESSGLTETLGKGVTPTTEDPRPGGIVRPIKTSPVRFDMNQFSDEKIDEAVGDPIAPPQIASDRDAPTENAQAYLDLGLDVRPTAFPMYRGRRNRRNRK